MRHVWILVGAAMFALSAAPSAAQVPAPARAGPAGAGAAATGDAPAPVMAVWVEKYENIFFYSDIFLLTRVLQEDKFGSLLVRRREGVRELASRERPEKQRLSLRKGAQSLHRAIALLRIVGRNSDGGATLSQIAREADLHVATAHRMLSVLHQEGFISHNRVSKRYHLGLELHILAGSARQFTIRHQFRIALERIAQDIGDTAFLLIRSGNDALCIDRVEGKLPIGTVPIDIGIRRPLGIGAGSLALIAFLPPDQMEPILLANAGRFPQYKNLTTEGIRSLASESGQVGYVVSEGLFHEGVISMGIPIFNKVAVALEPFAEARSTRRRRGSWVTCGTGG